MLYINVGADALIGLMAGLFGEQALQYGLPNIYTPKDVTSLYDATLGIGQGTSGIVTPKKRLVPRATTKI